MSIGKLAVKNFRESISSFLSLILSLAFTVMVLYNYQSLIYTDVFAAMPENSREYVGMVVQMISIVLACFMFFFTWYSTNVFLNRRKREIGTYVFMGLSNQRIAGLYTLEAGFIGVTALVLGIGGGILLNRLFQMVVLRLSEISVDFHFTIAFKPILITSVYYLGVYFLFMLKGYLNIVSSSVLNMISANRKNEYVKARSFVLILKALLGILVLSYGFYLAVREGGIEVMGNLLKAVVLVIIGVYLLFGGFLPLLCQGLLKIKPCLYHGERTLWLNNLVFRMKKNYRAYAMTCILMLCSVTALATGFAMKNQYDNMSRFRSVYTFQILSSKDDLRKPLTELIEKDNTIAYTTEVVMNQVDANVVETQYGYAGYGIFRYSDICRLAEETGLPSPDREPADDEVISLGHVYLLSFMTDKSNVYHKINGKTYHEIQESSEPYLGYLQENGLYFVVNDQVYEELRPSGQEIHMVNFGLTNPENYLSSQDDLELLVEQERAQGNWIGRITTDPEDAEAGWIRVLYSLCVFVFLVFIFSSGSILFMKLYNDAFEEKARYAVLKKIGCEEKKLSRAISREIGCAYILPFLVMTGSAYFSVHALEKLMSSHLMGVYVVCVAAVFVGFLLFYALTVRFYKKNVGI